MDRQGKIYQDEMTVEKYRQQLRKELKNYGAAATARAINNRKARGLAIGEAALKVMDSVRECSKNHLLMPGTLVYMIEEKVIYPTSDKDRKEFEYEVKYQVTSNEKAWTEEEIERKCEDLTFRLRMETEEMFPVDGEQENEGYRDQVSGEDEEEEDDTSSVADATPSPQGEGLYGVPQGEG